jgi:hypothetical protein
MAVPCHLRWPSPYRPAYHGARRRLRSTAPDLEEIADALADQMDYEHRWLINPQTGRDRVLDGRHWYRRADTGRPRRAGSGLDRPTAVLELVHQQTAPRPLEELELARQPMPRGTQGKTGAGRGGYARPRLGGPCGVRGQCDPGRVRLGASSDKPTRQAPARGQVRAGLRCCHLARSCDTSRARTRPSAGPSTVAST